MGRYVDTHCKGAEGINEILAAAAEKIKLGGITIGEWHNKPYGRAIVYDLIEIGFVKRLFIELEDFMTFSKDLRNGSLGKPHEEWPQDGKFIFDMGVNLCDARCDNPLPMLPLIQTAVSKSVKVYFYDVHHDARTSPAGMQARNEAMAKVFLKHTVVDGEKNKSVGAVALVGGEHLRTPPDDKIYTLALQTACKIPHDHVFNLLHYK
jgi:hypothetical protein